MADRPWDARIAAWLVRPLVGSPVSPNHITTLRLVVGLAGCALLATGGHALAGTLLVAASNLIDHADGELARMAGKHSRVGHLYDLACDALVTVGLFVGIGAGLAAASPDGARWPLAAGIAAGLAVAGIFQLRHLIESARGKAATRQPSAAGFEAEDVLYLLPLVAALDGLRPFLLAAVVGAPAALALVAWQYRQLCRTGA